MSDLNGRVFLITGANTGIGYTTAKSLAQRGAHVVITCRTMEKAAPVVDDLKKLSGNDQIEALAMDLGSLKDVRRAALEFRERKLPLHVLINNAGLAGTGGLTSDGLELVVGVNHVGPYLFTRLLEPVLRSSTPARIVNVASEAHYNAKRVDWSAIKSKTKTTTTLDEYAQSKLANVLFTKELARRWADSGITTYALHPGVVATDVWRGVPAVLRWLPKLFMLTPEQGAATTLHCATDAGVAAHTGRYYDKSAEKRPNRAADDEALAKELWEQSEALVAAYL